MLLAQRGKENLAHISSLDIAKGDISFCAHRFFHTRHLASLSGVQGPDSGAKNLALKTALKSALKMALDFLYWKKAKNW